MLLISLLFFTQFVYSGEREIRPIYLQHNSGAIKDEKQLERKLALSHLQRNKKEIPSGNPIKRFKSPKTAKTPRKTVSLGSERKRNNWVKKLENRHNKKNSKSTKKLNARNATINRRIWLKDRSVINAKNNNASNDQCLPEHVHAKLILRNPSYVKGKKVCND